MAAQVSKKRKFVADGVFFAELNELLTRELAEDGYSGVEVPDAKFDHFTKSEDQLLRVGLDRFGTNAWEFIHVYLMPCKTEASLKQRYKNASKRSAPDNPLKVRV